MRRAKRDRKKEAFWRRAMREQSRSGLCIRAWCRKHALGEPSFHWWRRELARRDGEALTFASRPVTALQSRRRQSTASPPAAFVPVHISADSSTTAAPDRSGVGGSLGCIEIVLPHQGRVRLTGPVDRQALTDVLAVLTSTSALEAEAAGC